MPDTIPVPPSLPESPAPSPKNSLFKFKKLSFKNLSKDKVSKIIGPIGLFLLIVSIPITVFLSQRSQDTRSRASSTAKQFNLTASKTLQVCQLTGLDNSNVNNVKGTDLGISFKHKDRIYFLFGDTNTLDNTPNNILSNVLAYTDSKDLSSCPKLHFITANDLYPDVANFYAREANLQAEEETKANADIDEFIFADQRGHYDWGKNQSAETLKNELNRKYKKVLEFYNRQNREKLADYYAKTAVRFNKLGFTYRQPNDSSTFARDFLDYQTHYNWALQPTTSLDAIFAETTARSNKIADNIANLQAKQAIPSKIDPNEYTLIPTGGISLNNKIYAFYMSIKEWGEPGIGWTTNQSGVAVSSDDGHTFERKDNLFASNSNFAQSYPVNDPQDPSFIYLYGIPSGRAGGLKLAKVPVDKLEDKNSYQFCQLSADYSCQWIKEESQASLIVNPPVSEMSVIWSPYLNQWLLSYFNHTNLVIRSSVNPWGPWTSEVILYECKGDFTQCYAPFMIPQDTSSPILYFTASSWGHYNVFLFKTSLQPPLPTQQEPSGPKIYTTPPWQREKPTTEPTISQEPTPEIYQSPYQTKQDLTAEPTTYVLPTPTPTSSPFGRILELFRKRR